MRISRRSIYIFILVALFVLINLAARDSDWRYEWTRASMSFAFLSVMLAPVFAGGTTWWASRIIPALGDVLPLSPRRASVVLHEVTRLYVPVSAAMAMGCLVMGITCAATGGFFPVWPDALPVVSAFVLVYLAGVIGFVVGGFLPSIWMAPMVALAVFGAILAFYGTHLAPIVQVGGATASLIGVVPNWKYHAVGIAASILIILGLLLMSVVGRRRSAGRAWLGFGVVVVSLGCAYVVDDALTGEELSSRLVFSGQDLSCEPTPKGYQVCLGAGYGSLRPAVDAAIDDVSAQAVSLGVEPPSRWDQRGVEGSAFIDPLDPELAVSLRWEIINREMAEDCPIDDVRDTLGILVPYAETGVISNQKTTSEAFEALRRC